MFLKLAAFVLCIAYVSCDEYVNHKPCVNTTTFSQNMKLKVSGCSASDERCILIKGTNHTVAIEFEPTKSFLNKTYFRVYGVFEKFSVPYGRNADACASAVTMDDQTSCTDTEGFLVDRRYKHLSTFAVSSTYPTIKLGVRFAMYDRRYKDNMMCLEIPVEIKDPSPSENETK